MLTCFHSVFGLLTMDAPDFVLLLEFLIFDEFVSFLHVSARQVTNPKDLHDE